MYEAGQVKALPIDDILPNRFQPRIKFSESEVLALSESIKNHGVIQPILVRPIGDKYEIIAGERRYKASVMAGLKEIPAIVKQLDDKQSAELALIENVQRKDLTPIEEALSYKKILDMGYLTQEQLASKLGKKQSTIANKLRLLNLDEDVQNALLYEKISERHARSLLKLNKEDQKAMLKRIIEERLTVRQTDLEIQKLLKEKNQQQDIVNEDIEILDFPEEETVKNMAQNQINQMPQQYNIPTNEIQNDVPEAMVTPQMTSVQSNATTIPTPEQNIPQMNPIYQTINPGFMDVDKIVETAQDINRPTQKDKKTIEDLLKPDEQMIKMEEQEKQAQQQKDEAETLLKPGKFFNLSDFEDIEDEPEQNGFIENIDQAQANMDFGVKPTPAPTTGFDFDKFFNPSELKKTLEPSSQNSNNIPTSESQPVNVANAMEMSQPQVSSNVFENNSINSMPTTVENTAQTIPQEPFQFMNQNIASEESTATPSFTSAGPEIKKSEEKIEQPQFTSIQSEMIQPSNIETQLPDSNNISFHVEPEVSSQPSLQPTIEIPTMSEEEFLNSIPDSNLPLSSLPKVEKKEEPKVNIEPQYDYTNLDLSDIQSNTPTISSNNTVPLDHSILDNLVSTPVSPSNTKEEPSILFEPEISTIEPSINENANSFLFEPDDSEKVSTSTGLFEPEQPVITISEDKPQPAVEIPQEVKLFDVQKVSQEAKNFAQTLQDKGYQVRIEEYDFEDLYQVVFKVRKD